MGQNKDGIPQPNLINSKDYLNNYDEINWESNGTYCDNCGILLDIENMKNHPENYIWHEDGAIECKECNFN